jgi:hypothetical protein
MKNQAVPGLIGRGHRTGQRTLPDASCAEHPIHLLTRRLIRGGLIEKAQQHPGNVASGSVELGSGDLFEDHRTVLI